jgi:hypothetical protein
LKKKWQLNQAKWDGTKNKQNPHKFLTENLEEKRPLMESRLRHREKLKINLRNTQCGEMN